MATKDTTAMPQGGKSAPIPADRIPAALHFTASNGLYAIAPGALTLTAVDQLTARLSQLSALLTMTTGSGFGSFNQWNDDIRSNYLWCCAMMARECKQLATLV